MTAARRCMALLLTFIFPALAAADERRLTLEQCLLEAVGNALEIREGSYAPGIARTRVDEADSDFDHLLSFRTSGGLAVAPSGSILAGADQVREQSFGFDARLQKRVRWGGSYAVAFTTSDLLTNNSFFTVRPQWRNQLSLNVTHPLLRTSGYDYNRAQTLIAEAGVRGAEQEYLAVLNSTLATVERLYWNLVFLREDLEVKRYSKKVAEELLRISRRRLEHGAGTRIELVQAQAGVAEREKELILAEFRVENGIDLLRSFVYPFGTSDAAEIVIVPADPVAISGAIRSPKLTDKLRAAFESRPDVLAYRERLEEAGIRVLQADNELLPKLDLFGTIGLTGLKENFFRSTGDIFQADYTAWEIGISLEFPLGNRAAEARYRRAILTRSRLAAGFETLKNRVTVEVRNTVRLVDTVIKEISAARRATAAAQAQFDAEKDRLEADKSTNYQLLQTEEDLSRARSQEILALVALRLALVDVEEVAGTFLAARGLAAPRPEEPSPETLAR